eukprot:208994_1
MTTATDNCSSDLENGIYCFHQIFAEEMAVEPNDAISYMLLLLCHINKATNDPIAVAIAEYMFCGNCINQLFDYYQGTCQTNINHFVKITEKHLNEKVASGVDIYATVFSDIFHYPYVRKIIINDFNFFKLCCKIWYQFATSSYINIKLTTEEIMDGYAVIPKFFISFLLSMKHWNHRNIAHFAEHYFEDHVTEVLLIPNVADFNINYQLFFWTIVEFAKQYQIIFDFKNKRND